MSDSQKSIAVPVATEVMKAQISIDELIAFLNSLIQIDPYALFALFTSRFLCNENLALHPTVQVRQFATDKGHGWEVGILGLINGMFGVDSEGYGPIIAIFNERGTKLLGFRRTDQCE